MTNPPERLVAALADRYRIERELGVGGMATVYLAEDLKHDRKVALKVLKPELAAVIGGERFVVEIKTTAALQHPHILPLFDSGTVDGFLYYVMPYIEGETLRDKLNRETQLGIDEAVRITSEVADALDYAHRHGVIHRDIKPENILLHDGRPMVADFGIALALSAAAGGRMTETGMSLGTPHYMSPEQATADKDISNRSDIYSLGSVLYEMLTGEPPHMGNSAQQIIMKIVTEEARAGHEAAQDCAGQRGRGGGQGGGEAPGRSVRDGEGVCRRAQQSGVRDAGDHRGVVRRRADRAAACHARGRRRRRGRGAGGRLGNRPPRRRSRQRRSDRGRARHARARGQCHRFRRSPTDAPGDFAVGTAHRLRGPEERRRPTVGARTRRRRGASTRRTPRAPRDPFFSPDGESIGFYTGTGSQAALKAVSFAGGAVRTIVRDSLPFYGGGSWGDDGRIYFTYDSALASVAAAGGPVTVIARPDSVTGGSEFDFPEVLPGSQQGSRDGMAGSAGASHIAVIDVATGRATDLHGGHDRALRGARIPGDRDCRTAASLARASMPHRLASRARPLPITAGRADREHQRHRAVRGLVDRGHGVYERAAGGGGGLVWVDRTGTMTPWIRACMAGSRIRCCRRTARSSLVVRQDHGAHASLGEAAADRRVQPAHVGSGQRRPARLVAGRAARGIHGHGERGARAVHPPRGRNR